jgi:PAS domain S-box-containing protein
MIATEHERAQLATSGLADGFHLALLESVEAPVLALDPDLIVLYANPAYTRLLAVAPEALVGRDLAELGPAFGQSRSHQVCREVLASGQPQTVEGPLADRYLSVQFSRTPHGIVAVGTDITARRAAEEAEARAQQRLDTLLGRLPQAVLYETGGGREFISQNIAALLGYSSQAFAEQNPHFPSLIDPDDRAISQAAFERWRAAGAEGVLRTEFRCRRADGGELWLADYMIEVRPAEEPSYISGVMVDITAEKVAAAEQQRLAEGLRLANETARRLSGILEPERLISETVQELQDRFGLYHVHLYLLDAAGERLVVRAGSGPVGQVLVAEGHSIQLGTERSLVALAASDRQAVKVDDVSTDAHFLPNPQLPDTRSEVAVPLVVRGRLLGVLDVQDDAAGRFDQADVDTFGALAGQIAVALDNARLFGDLTATQRRLDTLIARLPQVVLYETGGDSEYISSNVADLMGYPIESFRSDRNFFPSLIHPDDVSAAHDTVQAWRAAGAHGVARIEFRARRSDGSELWLADYMVDVVPEQGKKFMSGVMVDITERKAAEAEREHHTAQLQLASATAQRLSGILEPERLMTETVQQLQERFGLYHVHLYLLDETGQRLVVRAGSGNVGRLLIAEAHAIPLGTQRSLVAEAARRRDVVKVDDVADDPLFLANPRLPDTRSEVAVPLVVRERLLGVLDVQDDSPGRFGAADVDTFRALAGQVAVALDNARLYDDALRVADRLRELDRLKSEFLANMSHELRTPLNSILGYAELLLLGLNGQLDTETVQDIQTIYDNGQQLLGLINDILDLAKIEAGHLRLDLGPVDVATVLGEVKTANGVLVLNKPIQLHLAVEQNLPPVRADRLRLAQILNNLVSNAVKFTAQGDVWLRARPDDGFVAIDVADSGIGIAPEDVADIFDKFHQIDGSFTRRARGSGLGLAITDHLVQMHGGTLGVTSTLGVGSTFTVRLPMSDPDNPWNLE